MAAVKFAVLMLAMLSACAIADDDTESAADLSPEAELIALDDAWIDAEVSGDRAALERILHEDFLATFASGRTIDRSEFINRVTSNRPAPFKVVHDVIRVHGNTALVIDVSEDGKTKFTWIAIKSDGQWRVISETFSRVESP